MYSKVKFLGHPVHPMLVAFPITFYVLTVVAFAVYQFGSQSLFMYHLAYFSNMAAVITAALAAVPGFLDWALGIPKESAAHKRGLLHMGLNVVGLVLFIWSAAMIWGTWAVPEASVAGPLVLTLIGVLLVATAGYHGWELIATHKVGVSLTPEQQRLEPVEKMKRVDHEISSSSSTPRPRTI